MKLNKILDNVNSLEKNSFLKIIDNIISNKPKNHKEIEKILSENNNNLKSIDNINITKVFNLITDEFSEIIKQEFVDTSSQLDILIDIIIKDGRNLIKEDWFANLYDKEIKSLKNKTGALIKQLESDKSEINNNRKRDYLIYKACVNTAYFNDNVSNRDTKITNDELSILLTLSNELKLSQEEIKLINYIVIPPVKLQIDKVINDLKVIGLIFYSKKNRQVYVADEVVKVLREIRNKQVADKFYRRFLKLLREPQVNVVCRNHNIDTKLPLEEKISNIINEGILFSNLLSNELHKEGITLTEKKKFVNEIWEKGLEMSVSLKGTTLEEKIANLISYFDEIEKDEKIGISIDGYGQLLSDLNETYPELNQLVRAEFEMQDEFVLKSEYLLDYNIKPRDILDIIENKELLEFCKKYDLKQRGNPVLNILDGYKDSENLFIENYVNIGFRDLNSLKENGIIIKEANLGLKFEEVTKNIFEKLGFVVDEDLKKKLNTKKNQIDIVLNLGEEGLIIIECKTVKESGYNKFSSVTRQMKSYIDLATGNGHNVVKSLLVAPDFSDDFVNDCDLDFELNLSLITASSLLKILGAFKVSKHKQFPYQLLMKDVLIKEDRIIKAINKK
ncbi:MAG: hypothetical protein HRT66_00240 [Flavobacteriaceae bacterium]|nr:hypothetical protein [Flavobacteriaceae bacterium]